MSTRQDYTVSLPISCTYDVSSIYAVDEGDALDYAFALYRSRKVAIGRVRKARLDAGTSCAVPMSSCNIQNAAFVTERASGAGCGELYDVILVIYGYYVVQHVKASSKYDAAVTVVDNANNNRFKPQIGDLKNPQIGMCSDDEFD